MKTNTMCLALAHKLMQLQQKRTRTASNEKKLHERRSKEKKGRKEEAAKEGEKSTVLHLYN